MPKYSGDFKQPFEKRRIVTLMLTSDCNLRCKYCYEEGKGRHTKAMTVQTAQRHISKYMEGDDGFDAVEIHFFGGEPLLEFATIREVLEWFHTREWTKKHHFMIGTNGTLLNEEIKHFLVQYKDCLTASLSLDGNRAAHNLSRDDSYDQLAPHIPYFMEHWPHQPMKMTICAETIPHLADSIIEMEEMGLNFSANVVFEDIWGDPENKEKLLQRYSRELDRLVDFYSGRPELFPVRPILGKVPEFIGHVNWNKKAMDGFRRYCGAGHEMVTIDCDGQEVPCHRFAEWVTGKRCDPSLFSNHDDSRTDVKPDTCASCKLMPACPTCAGFNWQINGTPFHRTTFHCEAYKLEVLASAKLELNRLTRLSPGEVAAGTDDEKISIARRTEAIFNLIEEGI